MKKKHIIIAVLCALVLAGATVGAMYALDGTDSADDTENTNNAGPGAPVENAILVKDDPSIKVDVPETYTDGSMVYYYTEQEKTYLVEHEKVRAAISDVISKDESLKKTTISDSLVDECIDMTKEQIREYVEYLAKIGAENIGPLEKYPRALAQARGEISLDAERLTVEALDEIISQSADESEMYIKLSERYGEPDYRMSCSGTIGGAYEYWLDDEGSKRIGFSQRWDETNIYLCDGEADVTELYSDEQLDAIFGGQE